VADLLRMLTFASRSLEAQRFGLDVTGQNIANVNTAGYTRRVIDFAAVPPVERESAGGGVEVLAVRSLRDQLLARRLLAEYSAEQRESVLVDVLGVVEVALGAAGESLDGRLDDFFDAWAGLADAPTSVTARQEVVGQGQSLAAAFHDMFDRLSAAVADTDQRVRTTVDQINGLAGRVASLNRALSETAPGTGEALYLRDELHQGVEQLASLVDVRAVQRADGGFDVELAGSGRPLVIGEHAHALEVTDRAGSGLAEISSAGVVVTASISGGALGGLLKVRDGNLPSYLAALDELAYAVAERVNDLHDDGVDANGVAGGAFFDPLASEAGAAEAIEVRAALSASGGEALLAAAAPGGGVGDNTNARALARLRDARVLAGGAATLGEGWAQIVYRVGRDTSAAREELASRAEVVLQIRNLQDSVSGISLDEEAANMLRFQRAYEANARYLRAIDDTLDVLMQAFAR
jgi:flagellar hook-associated protein 1 FlgK